MNLLTVFFLLLFIYLTTYHVNTFNKFASSNEIVTILNISHILTRNSRTSKKVSPPVIFFSLLYDRKPSSFYGKWKRRATKNNPDPDILLFI